MDFDFSVAFSPWFFLGHHCLCRRKRDSETIHQDLLAPTFAEWMSQESTKVGTPDSRGLRRQRSRRAAFGTLATIGEKVGDSHFVNWSFQFLVD